MRPAHGVRSERAWSPVAARARAKRRRVPSKASPISHWSVSTPASLDMPLSGKNRANAQDAAQTEQLCETAPDWSRMYGRMVGEALPRWQQTKTPGTGTRAAGGGAGMKEMSHCALLEGEGGLIIPRSKVRVSEADSG